MLENREPARQTEPGHRARAPGPDPIGTDPSSASPEASRADREPRTKGPPIILIAERDVSVRKLQALFLERAAFKVVFVDDGEEAFASALASPPALVVTEILIPRLDGLALCRRLRAEHSTRDIPVIVFSILAAAQRAREAGATAFLRKPLVDSIFVAAVQDLIAAQPTGILGEPWVSK